MAEDQLRKALAEFVGAFEVVFRHDWDYTKVMLGDEAENCSFIEPGLEDESEDWGARGALLDKYRKLLATMKVAGIEPVFPFPLEARPASK